MEEKTFIKACATTALLLLIACVLFFAGFLVGRRGARMPAASETILRDTVYLPAVPVRDTIILRSCEAAGEVVATLPVAGAADVPQPPAEACQETAEVFQKDVEAFQKGDSASVVVPIEQRVYEGEYYKATVEGYRPSLVDMQLKIPAVLVTETKTVTKRKLWSVTIGPQLGYGITPAGLHPYAGVGVTFGLSF